MQAAQIHQRTPLWHRIAAYMAIAMRAGAGGARFRVCQRWAWKALVVYALFGCMYLRSVGAVLPTAGKLAQEPWGSMLPMFLVLGFIAIATNPRLVGGCKRVTVTDSTLLLETRMLGFTTSRRTFHNQQVSDLRCDEWFPSARYEHRESGIRFEYEGQTIDFARNATAADAQTLVEGMLTAYPYPGPAAGAMEVEKLH